MGVVSKDGEYRLIDSGPLPEAVAASAAIPYIFNPVHIPGGVQLLAQWVCQASCPKLRRVRCRHVLSCTVSGELVWQAPHRAALRPAQA